MQSISTIGLYIAKSVFQVHGVDAAGQVVGGAAVTWPLAARAQQLPKVTHIGFWASLPPQLGPAL
jgi:hypothetical protein